MPVSGLCVAWMAGLYSTSPCLPGTKRERSKEETEVHEMNVLRCLHKPYHPATFGCNLLNTTPA